MCQQPDTDDVVIAVDYTTDAEGHVTDIRWRYTDSDEYDFFLLTEAEAEARQETFFADMGLGTSEAPEASEGSSGADNDYWKVFIGDPKRLDPYWAECDDLIEKFQMSYQEGEAFKAIWRNGMLRLGHGKPGDTHIRNAQKSRYYSTRWEAQEQRKLQEK